MTSGYLIKQLGDKHLEEIKFVGIKHLLEQYQHLEEEGLLNLIVLLINNSKLLLASECLTVISNL
jgi:hypothetical protein